MTDDSETRPAAGAKPDRLPQEVADRLPERDPDALEAFFDLFFDRVYGYVRRLVGDEHLAEDLTQDVFTHVHRALPTYDPQRDIRPWVFTIATNKVRDYWRSRRHRDSQREASVERDGAADHVGSGDERPWSQMADEEMHARVRQAIEELPEGMRVTILLRAYEGLSFEAIGKILERNEVAARKRYSRALAALGEALGPAWQVHAEGS
jgi:RNA polymerase sigma-70 factor (ECF subfamily)